MDCGAAVMRSAVVPRDSSAVRSATTSVPVPSLVKISASKLSGGLVADDVHPAHAAADRILDRRGFGQHAVLEAPWSRRRFKPLMSVYETTELGSSTRSRIPCAPVHSTSFSADSAPPMAAATVSALMLSNMPFESADRGLTTGINPLSSSFSMTAALTESMLPTNP